MNYKPTKEELIYDYTVLNLSYQEITEKYGYKTRQVVTRWFKNFGIEPKSKAQLQNERFEKKIKKPSKDELIELYKLDSISEISRKLNVSRKIVSDWIKEYDIEVSYFKYSIDDSIFEMELKNLSLKEIEIKYSFPIVELKRRKLNKIKLPEIHYSNNRLKEIFSLYNIHNQGFSNQIILDDLNVYNSILENTKDHMLQSDKITERVYRILNDYTFDQNCGCKKCNTQLKFYTMELGYGNSLNKLCNKCVQSQLASSIPSQKLFWDIFNYLDEPDDCHFNDLNKELTLYVEDGDKEKLNHNEKLNKVKYVIDFTLGNKIIEYDGKHWHSDEERELIKDEFLKSKGYEVLHIFDHEYKENSEHVLKKCIKFLTE